jgi:fructosamine-3-kinase
MLHQDAVLLHMQAQAACSAATDLWTVNSVNSVTIACAALYVRCLACTHATGFTGDFWCAYHEVLPKAPGFDRRKDLYLLYHYLNHTNLFGGTSWGLEVPL